eukprot:c6454_g1_i2.p1 GENE.c6454_g1_i2~~c6454_g1_i2.p1  ORF type:complete len:284 (+),score=68.61 c6454_g1_i2:105-854(+)
MAANKALVGFQETKPNFPPTFKMVRGSQTEYNPQRIPSYCDRILYSSLPGLKHRVKQCVYSSAHNVTSSDHKPVYSLFEIDVFEDDAEVNETAREQMSFLEMLNSKEPKNGLSLRFSYIKTRDVNDEIASCPSVVVKLHSPIATTQNVTTTPVNNNTLVGPQWLDVPSVELNLSQSAHLAGKHLFISLWDASGLSSKLLGQAVLSLDNWVTVGAMEAFELRLSRYGVLVGTISGIMELGQTVRAGRRGI